MTNPKERLVVAVDDTANVRKLFEEILKEMGESQVAMFSSAEECRDYLATSKQLPRLILLDLVLGSNKEHGLSFLQFLKSDPRYTDIPVIIITADDDPATKAVCLQTGAADVIYKSDNLELIEKKIRKYLD